MSKYYKFIVHETGDGGLSRAHGFGSGILGSIDAYHFCKSKNIRLAKKEALNYFKSITDEPKKGEKLAVTLLEFVDGIVSHSFISTNKNFKKQY